MPCDQQGCSKPAQNPIAGVNKMIDGEMKRVGIPDTSGVYPSIVRSCDPAVANRKPTCILCNDSLVKPEKIKLLDRPSVRERKERINAKGDLLGHLTDIHQINNDEFKTMMLHEWQDTIEKSNPMGAGQPLRLPTRQEMTWLTGAHMTNAQKLSWGYFTCPFASNCGKTWNGMLGSERLDYLAHMTSVHNVTNDVEVVKWIAQLITHPARSSAVDGLLQKESWRMPQTNSQTISCRMCMSQIFSSLGQFEIHLKKSHFVHWHLPEIMAWCQGYKSAVRKMIKDTEVPEPEYHALYGMCCPICPDDDGKAIKKENIMSRTVLDGHFRSHHGIKSNIHDDRSTELTRSIAITAGRAAENEPSVWTEMTKMVTQNRSIPPVFTSWWSYFDYVMKTTQGATFCGMCFKTFASEDIVNHVWREHSVEFGFENVIVKARKYIDAGELSLTVDHILGTAAESWRFHLGFESTKSKGCLKNWYCPFCLRSRGGGSTCGSSRARGSTGPAALPLPVYENGQGLHKHLIEAHDADSEYVCALLSKAAEVMKAGSAEANLM